MTVPHELASSLPAVSKTKPETDVIQTSFKQLQHYVTSNTPTPGGLFVAPPKLLLEDPVLKFQFLFFSKRDGVVGFFPATGPQAMLAGRVVTTLKSS